MDEKQQAALLGEFARIEYHASICKHAHFYASESQDSLSTTLGIPVVIINVLIGSTAIKSLGGNYDIAVSILSLFAAILASVQTYLSSQKKSMLHKEVGNMYSGIARESRILSGKFFDSIISLEEGWKQVTELDNQYQAASKKAQACPVSQSSLKKANKRSQALSEQANNALQWTSRKNRIRQADQFSD